MSSNPLPNQSISHHRPFISQSQIPSRHYGNEHADALAKTSITTYSDVADTSIKTADPEGNPIKIIYWLAKEYEEHRIIQNHPKTAQSPTSRLWYLLLNYHDTLQAHMHPLHKLGNVNTVANYLKYNQNLIKNGTANGAASNAYLAASYVPVRTKCIIMKCRTGTLYNQKHTVWFKHSISLTCLLCPQLDSALHILLRC